MMVNVLYWRLKRGKNKVFVYNSISSVNTEKSSLRTYINMTIPEVLSHFSRL